MNSLETTPLLEEAGALAPSPAAAKSREWKPAAVILDIATLGTGTLLAGLINVALVFVVPRIISVEDYGYWRMFGLYAGYVGFLHLGFADGALLRWAGRPISDFHSEIAPSLKFLFFQQLIVLAPLTVIACLTLSGPARFVALAVGAYAIVLNTAALLQFALQSAKIFRPVAVSGAVAPAMFLGLTLIWRTRLPAGFRMVTILFISGWLLAFLILFASAKPWSSLRIDLDWRALAKSCVSAGWPVVLANTGVMLILCADRLALSWAANIQDFAQYSLAASAMAVPVMAIQACSKVFFSHLAGLAPDTRRRIYGVSSRLLLMAWAALLPYYFALDAFVRHFLPRYTPSLQYARILLLGIPFFASVQILQMSYAYLHGLQRRFLVVTAFILLCSVVTTSLLVRDSCSLRPVAAFQVGILAIWWMCSEWQFREMATRRSRRWVQFLLFYGLISVAYLVATLCWDRHSVLSIGSYYATVIAAVAASMRSDLSFFGRMLMKPRVSGE